MRFFSVNEYDMETPFDARGRKTRRPRKQKRPKRSTANDRDAKSRSGNTHSRIAPARLDGSNKLLALFDHSDFDFELSSELYQTHFKIRGKLRKTFPDFFAAPRECHKGLPLQATAFKCFPKGKIT